MTFAITGNARLRRLVRDKAGGWQCRCYQGHGTRHDPTGTLPEHVQVWREHPASDMNCGECGMRRP